METVTLSKALKDLEGLLDQAVESGEPVVIKRKGKPDVAIVATADLPKPKKRTSHSDHLFQSEAAKKALKKAAADFDAGRIGWSGTYEELQDMVDGMLVKAGKKPLRAAGKK